MGLQERLSEDLKTAMREKREIERETLRMAIAGLKNRRIELMRDLTEQDELDVVRSAVKTRKESAEQYEKGGRPELAQKELSEIAVLERYLPSQLDEARTREAIAAIVKEQGLTEKRQLGVVMKGLQARHPGQIDGKLAQRLAGEFLTG
jgi:uncharacterized protein